MDTYQHHQCAGCPRKSHGSLDRQSNDRLGWVRFRCWERFGHGWKILRCSTWSDTDTNANSNRNGYSNGNTNTNCDCNRNSKSDQYSQTCAHAQDASNSVPTPIGINAQLTERCDQTLNC